MKKVTGGNMSLHKCDAPANIKNMKDGTIH